MIISSYLNPHLPYAVQRAMLIKEFHLNDPIWVQYYYYMVGLLQGNWGYTHTAIYSGPVTTAISLFLPNTIQLSIIAFIIAVVIAIPAGQESAVRKNSAVDQISRFVAFVGISLPVFWLAQILSEVFATQTVSPALNILPLSGTVDATLMAGVPWINSIGVSNPTHIMMIDALIHGNLPIFFSSIRHVILPAATLAFTSIAGIMRYMRASMVESLSQDYVKTARSKGLPEKVVIKVHARKNALIPVVTILGLLFAGLLGGVVVIEDLFSYPGMGLWTVDAVLGYDSGGIMGTTIVFGLILVTANFIVDLLYAWIDPRIRLGE
ncbi:MAG: ABC transporter permease [Thermoplasmata archaeon]|nr:ABC transporter permease [Thermoplasmata archaeon]